MVQAYDPFSTIDENMDRKEIPPFWTIDHKDDEKILEWCNLIVEEMERAAESRVLRQRINLAAYRGVHYRAQDTRRSEDSTALVNFSRTPRLAVNFIFESVEQHTAKMTKYRPAVAIDPADDDEYADKVIAKTSKEVLEDGIWYREDIDAQLTKMCRRKKIFGEDFLGIFYDPNAGDVHPDYKELQKKTGEERPRIPVLDDDGKEVMGVDGKPLYIDKPIRCGDMVHKFLYSWDMFFDPKKNYEQCEWGLYRETKNVDEVKAEHPNLADKIEANTDSKQFDADTLEIEDPKNSVDVWYLYHISTNELDQGRYIKFTKDVILINDINRYKLFGRAVFPWVRWTDIDVPGILRGVSTLEQGRPIQNVLNNLTSMILRNNIMCSHPKWMVPAGMVKLNALGNDSTVVQYQGPVPPKLAQANPTPKEVFDFRDKLKEEFFANQGIYPTSRGEPPAGVKAFVAMQFLDEQENERSNDDVAKHNRVIREIAMKDLAFAGTFWDDSKEAEYDRLKNLLGKKKASSIVKYWKMADLCRPYDIKIQNQSALPQQRAARTQFIYDYRKEFPNLMPDEMVVDLLDLGQSKKFNNIATVSVRAADEENDELCRIGDTSSPEPYEDHLMHYTIHLRLMNEKSTKDDLPKSHREKLRDHILAHEMRLWEITTRNPAYMQMVMMRVPGFPIYFTPPRPPMPVGIPPEQGVPQGQPQPAPGGIGAMQAEMAPGAGMEMAPGMESAIPPEEAQSIMAQSQGS